MMMLVNRMARRVFESSSLVTNTSMVQITAIESAKISSCPNGTDPSARARIAAPNAMPPPRMRQSSGRRSLVSNPISSTPMTETAGTTSPRRNTVSRASTPASQPDSPATARMPNESDKRPITWTMPSSARTASSGRGLPAPSRRETTSVDIASATTSWMTVPITISIAPRI